MNTKYVPWIIIVIIVVGVLFILFYKQQPAPLDTQEDTASQDDQAASGLPLDDVDTGDVITNPLEDAYVNPFE